MRKIILAFALACSGVYLNLLPFLPAHATASEPTGAQFTSGPETEIVNATLAIIRWTTANPGGTILHYAVVHYGKDPNHLDWTAKSPTRINPSRSEMVFRVRMNELEPGTTYYYKVYSEQANGISDPATSAVNKFTTQPTNRMSAKK